MAECSCDHGGSGSGLWLVASSLIFLNPKPRTQHPKDRFYGLAVDEQIFPLLKGLCIRIYGMTPVEGEGFRNQRSASSLESPATGNTPRPRDSKP